MFARVMPCLLAFAAATSTLLAADPQRPSATFKISEPTAVPGRTLAPGTYAIRVVDHLSDRYILRVQASGKDQGLFIGIPSPSLPQDTQGAIRWSAPVNGTVYLRGWRFASLPTALEFTYPKDDAVAVAKANNAQVPAVDPESEGMSTRAQLTGDEMHLITLWLLSPTHVGPNDATGIKAERLQQVASVAHKPAVGKLPHTAGYLPWVWLVGLASFTGALGLRFARLSGTR